MASASSGVTMREKLEVDDAKQCRPLELPGGRSRRRLMTYSPKLDRRVVLGNYEQRKLWLALEANSLVERFCERPRHLDGTKRRMIDFWVLHRDGRQQYWLLEDDGPAAALPKSLDGVGLRIIDPSSLREWDTPVANWERIVAQVTAWRRYRSPLLEQKVAVLVGVSQSLDELVQALCDHDPGQVEAAVFELVMQGRVVSAELASRPLDGFTRFERR